MYDLEKISQKEQEKRLEPMMGVMPAMLPHLCFDAKQLPEIRSWEVGEVYEAKVKIRMTGYSESKNLSPESEMARGDFDVIGIEPMKK